MQISFIRIYANFIHHIFIHNLFGLFIYSARIFGWFILRLFYSHSVILPVSSGCCRLCTCCSANSTGCLVLEEEEDEEEDGGGHEQYDHYADNCQHYGSVVHSQPHQSSSWTGNNSFKLTGVLYWQPRPHRSSMDNNRLYWIFVVCLNKFQ